MQLTNQLLFKSKKGDIGYSDLVAAFKQLGIKEGDSVFVHTEIFAFGRLHKDTKFNKDTICKSLIQSFEEVIGPKGNLMMTTFNLETMDSGVFNYNETPSQGGILTEYFRKQKDVTRSVHPTQSFAIKGPDKDYFLDIDNTTFGKGSINGKLFDKNVKLVALGTRFWRWTYFHYVEEMANLYYRKKKFVPVQVIKGEDTYTQEVITYTKSDRFRVNYDVLENRLLEKGLLNVVELGNSKIMVAGAQDICREGLEILKKDKHAFLTVQPLIPYWKGKLVTFAKKIVKGILCRK